MDSPRMDRETCCPEEATAVEAVPRRMAHTTKSSRKCCSLETTAAGYLAVLLTLVLYLAPHCQCMPTPGGLAENWWYRPCSSPEVIDESTRKPVRAGGKMKSYRRAKTQLQIAQSHFKKLQLEDMYKEVEILKDVYQYQWLPERKLEWFMNEYARVDSNIQEVAPKVLFQLHEDLQKFAVTLDKLYRHLHGEEHVLDIGKRRLDNLLDLCLELRKLLCEVEASLKTAGQQPPQPSVNSSYVPEDKWDDRRDKTAVLVQDWGILQTYGKFLLDWRSIMDKLLETTSGTKKRKLRGKGQGRNKNKKRPKGGNNGGRKGQGTSQEEQWAESSEGVGAGRAKKGGGGRSAERRAERKREQQQRREQQQQRREQQQQRRARPGTSPEQ